MYRKKTCRGVEFVFLGIHYSDAYLNFGVLQCPSYPHTALLRCSGADVIAVTETNAVELEALVWGALVPSSICWVREWF